MQKAVELRFRLLLDPGLWHIDGFPVSHQLGLQLPSLVMLTKGSTQHLFEIDNVYTRKHVFFFWQSPGWNVGQFAFLRQ